MTIIKLLLSIVTVILLGWLALGVMGFYDGNIAQGVAFVLMSTLFSTALFTLALTDKLCRGTRAPAGAT